MPVRLSRPVSKAARANHRHEFRPTGDALLRAGEYQLGQVISKALAALSRTIATDFIEGRINQIEFVELTVESLEPYRGEIDRALYRIALDEARDMNARIRKTINGELRQLGSPVRLVMPETIRKAAGVDLEWATTLASFDAADPTLPMRVATRNQASGILSGLAASEQNTIMAQISAGFTESQTFSTGRTVVGRTVQQTARSIVPILQEAAGTTMALAPGELAIYRSQYTNGLFPRWAQAVNNYADSQAGSLARQGITGRRALDVVDKRTSKYSDKLRRSRARMIARTETSIAQNQAMLGVMKDAQRQGLVSTRARKQWVTGPFDVCKICEGLNGVKVPINQSFPGIGRAHPPAHPNCRCIIELVPDYSRSPEPVGTGTPQDPFRYRFPDGWEAPINPVTTFAPSLLSPASTSTAARATAAEGFPSQVAGQDLARSPRFTERPDSTSYDDWIENVLPSKLEQSKTMGLYDDIARNGVGRPVDVNVTRGGEMRITSGAHRIAAADDLGLDVPVRYYGSGYKNATGRASSISVDELVELRVRFPELGHLPGSYS